ncbi:lysylphosphatidylglycerol synthase transmembrane domain-containing protein [Tomitella gaofuii]|uniref:lysylphosphatidylglycerol synthase transmembrane domain-containing protein n=1 Tax=Tomitella gaofuii TaxID=2760083 RepID=UPI001F39C592|nr:YbhN family protein [Tomitella gaofuii]
MPARDSAAPAPRQRPRFWWVRWVLGVGLVALLTAEGFYLWPSLNNSWHALSEIHWGWVAACILAQAASMSSFGRVQKVLLSAAGVKISQLKSLAVIYASTAMSLTLPAGQVFSTAFTYRRTRRWGASPVVASWQVAMSGVLAAAGLTVLGVGGALFVGTAVNPFTAVFSVVGLFALAYAGRYVANHPDSLEDLGRWALRWFNWARSKPRETGIDRWRGIIEQLKYVQLGAKDGAVAFGWSFYNWVADIACLGFACWAVGADPSISSLAIAYAAAKAVGAIPGMPGGLVFVEGTLIAALTAGGLTGGEAVASVLVYRIVSFILVAIVGWIIFLVLFRSQDHEDLAADRDLRERELAALEDERSGTHGAAAAAQDADGDGDDPPRDAPPCDTPPRDTAARADPDAQGPPERPRPAPPRAERPPYDRRHPSARLRD